MLTKRLWNFRNALDFALRQNFRWPLTRSLVSASPQDEKAAQEVASFLELFPWPRTDQSNTPLRIADIGCRTFFLAPTLDKLFRSRGFAPEIHGIELDAFRRMSNFRTRKEYGDYFAASIRQGKFHAMDFLLWKEKIDMGFLLNPFVLERSIMAWGLPLRFLQPGAIFRHCADRLVNGGYLLVSTPTAKEMAESVRLAMCAGLVKVQSANWQPGPDSIQTRPRLGVLFIKP